MKFKNRSGGDRYNGGIVIVSMTDTTETMKNESYKETQDASSDSRKSNTDPHNSIRTSFSAETTIIDQPDNVESTEVHIQTGNDNFEKVRIQIGNDNKGFTYNEASGSKNIPLTVTESKIADKVRSINGDDTVVSIDASTTLGNKEQRYNNPSKNNEHISTDKKTSKLSTYLSLHKSFIKTSLLVLICLLYLAYVVYSLTVSFGDAGSWRLLVCSLLGIFLLSSTFIKKTIVYKKLKTISRYGQFRKGSRLRTIIRWSLYVIISSGMAAYVVISTVKSKNPKNLISLAGIVVFILILVATSTNRTKINWHTVFWGFSLQFLLAIVILRTSQGAYVVEWMSQRLIEYIHHSNAGSQFVFGNDYRKVPFAFGALPQIIFFLATLSVLSHLGAIQFINYHVGNALAFVTGASPGEAMNAVANMFLATPEAVYFVKDYVEKMSEPQIFCILVNGMASLAGSAMIAFIGYGIPGEYLIAASAMSAPAALAAAKISMPLETDEGEEQTVKDVEIEVRQNDNKTVENSAINIQKRKRGKRRKRQKYGSEYSRIDPRENLGTIRLSEDQSIGQYKKQDKTLIQSFFNGAMRGLKIATVLAVSLLISMAALEFFNKTVEWFGDRAGVHGLTLESILSYPTWPFGFLMGIDGPDCLRMSSLLAVRAIGNPGIPNARLGDIMKNKNVYVEYTSVYNDSYWQSNDIILPQWNRTLTNGILTARSEVIGTYALCGFASVSTLGAQIGVFKVLIPRIVPIVSKLSFRILLVGSMASFFTACVAGLLYDDL